MSNNLLNQEVFSFKNIYRAYFSCRKNKRNTSNALKFELDWENNLLKLEEELKNKTYYPGPSICFAVNDPTCREIFAADFRDRTIHHLLVNQIETLGEKSFIYDSFACRKNKGMHEAVNRLNSLCHKISSNYRKETFYAQLDISGFFMNIDHYILYEILTKLVEKQKFSKKWKDDILWLAGVIIFHKPTDNYTIKGNRKLLKEIPDRKSLFKSLPHKGLPIGNYSSQFFGNLYLNELDQFLKRKLKCRYYLRYVDDFIILGEDREKLIKLSQEINTFLKKELGLELNPTKTKIENIEKGIDFLGYVIRKNYILSRKRVVRKFRKKVKVIKNINLFNSENPLEVFISELSSLNSYYGHLNHANAYGLRKNTFNKYLLSFRSDFISGDSFKNIKINRFYQGVYREISLLGV